MEETNDQGITTANGYLVAIAISFVVFWVLTLLKAAYPALKSTLSFYDPIGPLLGLYTVSTIVFVVFSALFHVVKIKNQVFAFWFFVVSTIIFAIMVFPPIFEPIAHVLEGK